MPMLAKDRKAEAEASHANTTVHTILSNRKCDPTPTPVLTSAVQHIQRVRGHIPTWFQRLAPRGDVTRDNKT
jgi:hypothetical protein